MNKPVPVVNVQTKRVTFRDNLVRDVVTEGDRETAMVGVIVLAPNGMDWELGRMEFAATQLLYFPTHRAWKDYLQRDSSIDSLRINQVEIPLLCMGLPAMTFWHDRILFSFHMSREEAALPLIPAEISRDYNPRTKEAYDLDSEERLDMLRMDDYEPIG